MITPELNTITQNTVTTGVTKNKTKSFRHNFIFIIIGLLCIVSWYFYSLPEVNFWNSYVNRLDEMSVNSWNSSINSLKESYVSYWNFFANKVSNNPATSNTSVTTPTKEVVSVKDCGVGTAPDLKNPLTYENNAVLNCLGNSAVIRGSAKAVLKDALFPTIFQITNNNFTLSYGVDSTLVDITGKKLAGQYISCPLSIVKAIDETKNILSFSAPSLSSPSEYASQIYFYGTLGIFIENNLDQNKIQSLDCSGGYISSVIASYLKTQTTKSQ